MRSQFFGCIVYYTALQMDSATRIRAAIAEVFELRNAAHANPALGVALTKVKELQALRFQGSYSALLNSPDFAEPSRFFLEELYGIQDFSERDAQFSRIAKSLSAIFPASVVSTAIDIAELHALTEQLDVAVATHWLQLESTELTMTSSGYVSAWRQVGQREARQKQLAMVLSLGSQLARLTRRPGLATLLKMMRHPAASAGLSSLQQFLEKGFSTFGKMARKDNKAAEFLGLIQTKEMEWIASMYDESLSKQTRSLNGLLRTN